MPVTENVVTADTDEEVAEEQAEQFQPGELVATDATNDRIDLATDEQMTKEEKETCLQGLADKVSQRDLVSRRLEIRDAWKARYFDRGNQRLLSGKNGAWVLPQNVLIGGQSYNDHSKETNVYLAFRDTICAALTAGTPSVRFQAEDPLNPAGISASEKADKAKLLIERANDMPALQGDMARYLFTDGRCCVYTRHILDGQRFGYSYPDMPWDEDQLSYLPEEAGEGEQNRDQKEPEGPGPQATPRGSEVIQAFGVLETKLPIQANTLCESDYLQLSLEVDVTKAKARYPEKADEIMPATSPTAESDYERLARTSIMMGMRPSSMTSDSMTYNTTVQATWVRPSFFFEEKNDDRRQWLFDTFPRGVMIVQAGKVFCEARNESMDDHWALIHARPGDGMHRPALGSPLIPIQEKLNDVMDLIHESFMHLIPITWIDSEGIDANAFEEIQRAPGKYLKIKRRADKPIGENFYTETAIQIAEGLLVYLDKLFGEFAQFLCGAFPALFGGNTGSNDTAQGIASQRDQALGRIGLTWRNIKAAYAIIMKQAVTAAAEHRKDVLAGKVKQSDGTDLIINVSPDDLKGDLLCFADTDENFPESWVAQRMVWMNLLQEAKANPVIAAILATPQNLVLAKDKIGVPEIVIPAAASATKQMGEIALLLETGPMPNPAFADAQQKLAMLTQMAAGNPEAQAMLPQAQQMAGNIPQWLSTIQPGELDDDSTEIAAIKTWANESDGIKAARDNPQGYLNVVTHYKEHGAKVAAAAANASAGAQKPVNVSLAGKDLPPEGLVQLAAKVGIKLDAQKLEAQDMQERATDQQAALRPLPTPMVQ